VSEASGSDVERPLDPFSGHERFAERLGGSRPTARARPEMLEPMEVLDVSIDKLIDLEALEGRASFQGMVRAPRTLEDEDLDSKISDALTECKPQFHLRNLSRAERFADPDEPLDFEPAGSQMGIPKPDADAIDPMARVTPELLRSISSQTVRALREEHHELFVATAWNEHFSREIKAEATGPLWKPAEPTEESTEEPQ
jgi:hypothetical protein